VTAPDGASVDERLTLEELEDAWRLLPPEDRVEALKELPAAQGQDFFFALSSQDQAQVVLAFPPEERRSWMRILPPDDAADVIQAAPAEERDALLAVLDEPTRKEVSALLAYAEDAAGGLMSPRYARVRPDMTVDEAIRYLRRQAIENPESFYYSYVLDETQRLLGVVSIRELFGANPTATVREIMHTDLVTVTEDMDQEKVSELFAQHRFIAIPVVDDQYRMKGVVTADDIVDVAREEATEDIQKLGGTQALDEPYMNVSLPVMVRKRAVWLAVLFLGEMLTASAMGYYEHAIQQAVVLALFIPLIISSGGNSGSQASTLVIRAMSLGEVQLGDWWRVVRREVFAGLALGSILGALGFVRIVAWQQFQPVYGPHYVALGITLFLSLVGVVMFGTIAGSLLPFVLRALKLDPASASAPFVATLVDVSGLVIYFTLASLILRGLML
jgi:magnesium transporter